MSFKTDKTGLPREKLAKSGAESLKDEELLALLLCTGYKGKNVIQLSKEILRQYPACDLIRLPFGKLKGIKGVGNSKACLIFAAAEFVRRGFEKEDVSVKCPTDVLPFVADIRNKTKEYFVAFFLNARNCIIRRDIVSIGTLNASLVHPREVFKPAIEQSAASVIFIHNHPSGDPSPSEDDIKLTKRLVSAGEILGIDVLDHIIITRTGFLSMKAKGII
jgi:DNA repair protein RadC